jgi:hypothetical protein
LRFTAVWDELRGNSLQTFFDQLPSSLEVISLPSLAPLGGVVDLAFHEQTSRRLTVHQPEPPSYSDEEHLLSETALTDLLHTYSRLFELGLDLPHTPTGAWPRDALNTLCHFPHLSALELWFNLNNRGTPPNHSPPPQPALTVSSAAQLFTDLRHHSSYPTLRQLRIHSGHWPPRAAALGLPGDIGSSYAEDNTASFTCRVPDRDDLEEVVDVTSNRHSPRLNGRMRRIMREEERQEGVQGDSIALRVALDGRMRYRDWRTWKGVWPWPNASELMDAAEGWSSSRGKGGAG